MAEPNLQPSLAQVANSLTVARSTLQSASSPLPAPWLTLIDAVWLNMAALLLAGTAETHRADAILALRLSHAGNNACATYARYADQTLIYTWLLAGAAHRSAWTQLAIGWPNIRLLRTNLPLELANLTTTSKPNTTSVADRYINQLLQDPLGLTVQISEIALTAIPAGVYL